MPLREKTYIRDGFVSAGDAEVTGSLGVSGTITGNLTGNVTGNASTATTATSASFASTASFVKTAQTASFYGGSVTSASFASTASSLNPLNQDIRITGSVTHSGSLFEVANNGGTFRVGKNGIQITRTDGAAIYSTLTNSTSTTLDVDTAIRANNGQYGNRSYAYPNVGISLGYYTGKWSAQGGGTGATQVFELSCIDASNTTNFFLLKNGSTQLLVMSSSGNLLIGTGNTSTYRLDVSGSGNYRGSLTVTGSLVVTAGITGSLQGTATTASYVNTLNQNVLITGSLTIGATSSGSNENTLVLGPSPAGGTGEGGQILLQAPGGTYTSASMWDNWQNITRLLRGTNNSSDAVVAQFNMHSKQVTFPQYNSTSAFSGTLVGLLGFDSSGNILTTTTGSGGGGSVTINNNTDNYIITATGTANTLNGESKMQFDGTSLSITGTVTASGAITSLANGAMYFRGGDDAEFWDVNIANTVGIYGQQDATVASIKLGSGGGVISGKSSKIGIGTTNPGSTLDVSGNINATSLTGSLLGTASYAALALTASYALSSAGGGAAFPYTGSAQITGSLGVTGSLNVLGSINTIAAITASTALISGSGVSRLTVIGSGSSSPIFTVQGSQGELASITDSLSGSLFSVNDISGLPILEVFSDNTTLIGDYQAPALHTTKKISGSSGINLIYSLNTGSYDGVFMDYTAKSGSNVRAGNFAAIWSGSSVNYMDNSTTDFGNTSGLVFGASISGSNMIVTGSASTSGWTIKAIIRSI